MTLLVFSELEIPWLSCGIRVSTGHSLEEFQGVWIMIPRIEFYKCILLTCSIYMLGILNAGNAVDITLGTLKNLPQPARTLLLFPILLLFFANNAQEDFIKGSWRDRIVLQTQLVPVRLEQLNQPWNSSQV